MSFSIVKKPDIISRNKTGIDFWELEQKILHIPPGDAVFVPAPEGYSPRATRTAILCAMIYRGTSVSSKVADGGVYVWRKI
jgi:hypothetical protein